MTLAEITESFKDKENMNQYYVDTYRTDLHFPVFKLAVKCDKCGQCDRDIRYKGQKDTE